MKEQKTRCVTVIIETSSDNAIERMAKRQGKLKSAVFNDALRSYIEKQNEKEA